MPHLLVEYNGRRVGGAVLGRVLIGRKSYNGIVIDDPAVSRVHAWIALHDGQTVLTDSGSRTGTFVNGDRLEGARALQDGDQIHVGPARIVYLADDALEEGVEAVDFPHADSTVRLIEGGISFDCPCGAPLWVNVERAGQAGRCRYCNCTLIIPTPPQEAPHVAPSADPADQCGICQWHIESNQTRHICPDCGGVFHEDCWQENLGCSSYGCPQVNVLDTGVTDRPTTAAMPTSLEDDLIDVGDVEPQFPWDHLLLALSGLALLAGALAFGIPSLLVGLGVAIRMIRRHTGRRGMAILALLLSLVGVVGGLAASDFWWFAGRHIHYLPR